MKINKYSINLMWINKEKDINKEFIANPCNKDEFIEVILTPVIKWKEANPEAEINLWYDSTFTSEEAVKNTIALLSSQLNQENISINLKDIRGIEIIQSNPDVFSSNMPLYFRIDLIKLIICVNSIETDGMDSAIFTDFSIGSRRTDDKWFTKEQLYNHEIYSKYLNELGILLGRDGNGGKIENQFIQIINRLETINAIKHTINSLLSRAIFYLNSSQKLELTGTLDDSGFLATTHDIYIYLLATKKQKDGIKIRADVVKKGTDKEWVAYDPEKHGYIAFGNARSNRGTSFVITSGDYAKENHEIFIVSQITRLLLDDNQQKMLPYFQDFSCVQELLNNLQGWFLENFKYAARSDLFGRSGFSHTGSSVIPLNDEPSDGTKVYKCKFWQLKQEQASRPKLSPRF
jgi:hypothetical protein